MTQHAGQAPNGPAESLLMVRRVSAVCISVWPDAQRLRIVGLSNTESKDILRLLQAYVTRPENVVRVNWEPDQLVLFDNRITQHYAPDNYDGQPRQLNRVTIAGDVPGGWMAAAARPSRAIRRRIQRRWLSRTGNADTTEFLSR